jgi:hypothetical protein
MALRRRTRTGGGQNWRTLVEISFPYHPLLTEIEERTRKRAVLLGNKRVQSREIEEEQYYRWGRKISEIPVQNQWEERSTPSMRLPRTSCHT